MAALRVVNDVVRFCLELCALAALAYWGYGVDPVVMVAAPLAAALLWGAFVAPKARRHPPDPWRLVLEVAVLGGGAAALAASGHLVLGAVLAFLVAEHLALTFVLRQRRVV